MQDLIITVDGMVKQVRGNRALDGPSLAIPRGVIYGLLGPNGAGKTTLIRILATLLPSDAGTAQVAGFDITREQSAVRAHIGLAGQYAAVDGHSLNTSPSPSSPRRSSRRAHRHRRDPARTLLDGGHPRRLRCLGGTRVPAQQQLTTAFEERLGDASGVRRERDRAAGHTPRDRGDHDAYRLARSQRLLSWSVPIPAYAAPILRSREPNPFDRDEPRRPLRIFVDQPLMAGDVDGEGVYQGYPFIGNGSTGYPDAATIFRSYLRFSSFEVFYIHHDLNVIGAVVLDEPDFDRNELCFQVRGSDTVSDTGIDYIKEATDAAAHWATRFGLPMSEAMQGELYPRIGNEVEADIIVTDRTWLLDQRNDPRARNLTSLMSAPEALALMALYLRWHNAPVIVGGHPNRWGSASLRRSAAYAALPAFERWNQVARRTCDLTGNLTLHTLTQSLLTRVARAFKFRDNIHGLYMTMKDHEPEEMLCELDSLLYSLVGAFDVAAEVVDRMLGLGTKRPFGWQGNWHKQKESDWHKKLLASAPALHAYTNTGSEMQTLFAVLRWLRNTVHHEALDLLHQSDTFLATLPDAAQADLRDLLRMGLPGWDQDSLGVRVQPRDGATASKWLPGVGRYSVHAKNPDPHAGELTIDPRVFLNRIFPAALEALDKIMALTPLTGIPGYTNAWESPPRVNLPWKFSDTTAHRLRLMYGL